MDNALYYGAAALDTTTKVQEAVAYNVANLNTPAFKRRMVGLSNDPESFQSVLNRALEGTPFLPTELPNATVSIDFSQGDIKPTGNPLDVALQGPGFMKVQLEGEILYTRNGNFTVNAAGELVTQAGYPVVLNEASGPLSPTGGDPFIDKDGSVYQGGNRLGKLALADFEDPSQLMPENDGLYRAPEGVVETASTATVIQSALENTNVDAISEFVGMISAGRSFELATRIIRTVDDLLRRNSERT